MSRFRTFCLLLLRLYVGLAFPLAVVADLVARAIRRPGPGPESDLSLLEHAPVHAETAQSELLPEIPRGLVSVPTDARKRSAA